MKSKVDDIIYMNIIHLLEVHGISEHQCILACGLNSCYFSNIKKGITKHFRICDVVKIATFLEVTLDDLCQFKNTRDDFFIPHYKLLSRDEKVLTHAFKRLDPVGRINAAEFINEEFERTKQRARQRKQ